MLALCAFLVSALAGGAVQAQGFSGGGQNWSAGWGFMSASDRSIALQQAQMIRTAEQGADQTATYNSYYDNRYNYIDSNSGGGTVNADLHIGDEIGTNTNSVGAMNTGSTTIDLSGNGNTVIADNTADSTGCVDGSVNSANPNPLPGLYLNATPDGATIYDPMTTVTLYGVVIPVVEAADNACQ
jgi:hypothetical protein